MYRTIETALEQADIRDTIENIPIGLYDKAIEEFKSHIKDKLGGIRSIFQAGSIKAPGISDVDLFVVFGDEKKDEIKDYSIKKLSSVSRYAFFHEAIFLNKNLLENFEMIFPASNLRCIWGENIKIKPNPVKLYNNILFLMQIFITKIPGDIFKYALSGDIYERTIVVILYSMKHTVDIFKELKIPVADDIVKFCEYMKNVRKNWIPGDSKNKTILKDIVNKGICVAFDLLVSFDDFLGELIKCKISDYLKVEYKTHSLVFHKDWGKRQAINNFMKSSKRLYDFPSRIGAYMYMWNKIAVSHGGKKKNISGNYEYEIKKDLVDVFDAHAKYVNRYNSFNMKKFSRPGSAYITLWADSIFTNRLLHRLSLFLGKK